MHPLAIVSTCGWAKLVEAALAELTLFTPWCGGRVEVLSASMEQAELKTYEAGVKLVEKLRPS